MHPQHKKCLTFMASMQWTYIPVFCSDSSASDMPEVTISDSESEAEVRSKCRQCILLKTQITTLKEELAKGMSPHFSSVTVEKWGNRNKNYYSVFMQKGTNKSLFCSFFDHQLQHRSRSTFPLLVVVMNQGF